MSKNAEMKNGGAERLYKNIVGTVVFVTHGPFLRSSMGEPETTPRYHCGGRGSRPE